MKPERQMHHGEQARRERWRNPPPDLHLEPAERFDDRLPTDKETQRVNPGIGPEDMGPNARIVRHVLLGVCAGWDVKPSSRELYDAVRTTTPTERQRQVVRTWASETSVTNIVVGWTQRAYTIRGLVAALHRAKFDWPERIDAINQWARP